MKPSVVKIPVDKIFDWESFHDVFSAALGFPSFYGRNMDAWIDCMTSVDAAADGLTTVTILPGEILVLEIGDPLDFRNRCPEHYAALIECSAFVNFRRCEVGEPPVLALMPLGSLDKRNCKPAQNRVQIATYADGST